MIFTVRLCLKISFSQYSDFLDGTLISKVAKAVEFYSEKGHVRWLHYGGKYLVFGSSHSVKMREADQKRLEHSL